MLASTHDGSAQLVQHPVYRSLSLSFTQEAIQHLVRWSPSAEVCLDGWRRAGRQERQAFLQAASQQSGQALPMQRRAHH